MPADDNQIGSFTYSSQPHSAPTSKKSNNKLYRDNDKGNVFPLSVMADPRIVRGNTHSLAKKISLQTQLDLKATANTNAEKVFVKEDPSRPTFRYEVKPFSNNEIDVSQYLVEVPTIVKKQEVISQTDSFKERPKTPPYVPRKTGVDRSTQVEDVRELFSFDQEVSGMLEVLVSKTLQSALFEVESEAELLSLQIEAENFQKTIAIENDWIREKEIQDAKEVARVQERLIALEAAKKAALDTKTTIASLQMMRQTIATEQVEQIISKLYAKGRWELSSRVTARKKILPAIIHNAGKSVATKQAAHVVVDELLLSADELFSKLPSPSPPKRGKQYLQVSFRRLQASEEEGGPPRASTLRLSYLIEPSDSAISLENRIKNDIYLAKAAAASAAEAAAAAAAEGDGASALSEISTSELTLSQLKPSAVTAQILADRVNESLLVPVALDAPLLNFFAPSKDISFHVQIDVE